MLKTEHEFLRAKKAIGHHHQATDGTPRYVMFYHTNYCKSINKEMVGGYFYQNIPMEIP